MTRKQGGLSRRGYGRKGNQKIGTKGESGVQAKDRIAAESLVQMGAGQPAGAPSVGAKRKRGAAPFRQPKKRASQEPTSRKRVRQWRDAHPGGLAAGDDGEDDLPPAAKKRRAVVTAVAALPPALGATAGGRAAEFSPERRGESAAEQAAEYHVRQAAAHIEKLLRKDKVKEAAAALGGLVRRPSIRPLLPIAGAALSEDASDDTLLVNQIAALVKSKTHGADRRKADTRVGIRLLLAFLTESASPERKGRAQRMDDEEGEAGPSVRPGAIVRRLKMPPRAGHRLLAEARQHRRALEDEHANALLIDMQQRNQNRAKLTRPLLAKLHAWLLNYQHIRSCPDKPLLVRGPDDKKNVRVPRLLLEVSFTQAYLDAQKALGSRLVSWGGRQMTHLAVEVDGKVITLGENSFGKAMPPELRRMTQRQESCGCTLCIKAKRLHEALRRFRSKHSRARGYEPPDHATIYAARDAGAAEGGCERVSVGVPNESGHVATMRRAVCWLGRGCPCGGVRARYVVPKLEQASGAQARCITFRTFEQQVDLQAKPKADGSLRKKAVLVKRSLPIGRFHDEHYLPMLEEFDYHSNTEKLLRLCTDGFTPASGCALGRRDFAMKLGESFENAPQGAEHWQPETVTIETVITESHPPSAPVQQAGIDVPLKQEHTFHLSAFPQQDAAVVDRNQKVVIQRLRADGRLRDMGTYFEDTDGESKVTRLPLAHLGCS